MTKAKKNNEKLEGYGAAERKYNKPPTRVKIKAPSGSNKK